MNEIFEVLREKYITFGKNQSADRLAQARVRNAIISLCRDNLTSADQVFVFEVMPDSLKYVVSVLDDTILTSTYEVDQISESLFQARLVTLEVL